MVIKFGLAITYKAEEDTDKKGFTCSKGICLRTRSIERLAWLLKTLTHG